MNQKSKSFRIWLYIGIFFLLSQNMTVAGASINSQKAKKKMKNNKTIQKVIPAMLAMQRRA